MHKAVLLEETLRLLDIQAHDSVYDGTLGFAGHALAILSQLGTDGRYIAVDRDAFALDESKKRLSDYPNVDFYHGNYAEFSTVLMANNLPSVTKILLDLGVSSYQLDTEARGFSYLGEGPLDMRMNPDMDTLTAADILNTYDEDSLSELFKNYGDIRNPEKFVSKICLFRENAKYKTTAELLSSIKASFFFRNKRTVFLRTCAQVFQALRIEVNQELSSLEQFLLQVKAGLLDGGRFAIISFHSIEDRMVKRFYRENKDWLRPVNKKVCQVSYHDAKKNTRARSAKLRVFEKFSPDT